MKIIRHDSTNPYFNLAAEEYLIDNFNDDAVMLWRNDNTVVIGKNQNALEEINTDFVEKQGIRLVRRLTGGGAVFHDLGNVNYTIIQRDNGELFSNYAYFTGAVRDFLQSLGVHAELSGRNDMLIDGMKFSGNAQCSRNGKIMHHGTLMFSTDVSDIAESLTPDARKLASKSVKSVRSRVTNISAHLPAGCAAHEKGVLTGGRPMSVEDFLQNLYTFFTEHFAEYSSGNVASVEEYVLSDADMARIQKLADEKYSTWQWNYGAAPKYEWKASHKYDFGLVDIRLNVKKGIIDEAAIYGDFFGTRDAAELAALLVGVEHKRESVLAALCDGPDMGQYIYGMSPEQLAELICG